MAATAKTVCKRIDAEEGGSLYLLVKWWNEAEFDVDATDGANAWKAVRCTCPPSTAVGHETWLEKAREALGYSDSLTAFNFEFSEENDDARALRWSWPLPDAQLQGMGRILLHPTELAPCILSFLTTACELSACVSVMAVENCEAQRGIEQDMQALKQEVKDATHSRKSLYARCADLFNEKKREIEEKEREIQELRAQLTDRMAATEQYSDVTS